LKTVREVDYTKYVPFSPTIVPAISLYYNSNYTSFNPLHPKK